MVSCPHCEDNFDVGEIKEEVNLKPRRKAYFVLSCPKCNKFLAAVN